MKKIVFIWAGLCSIWFCACKKEVQLGDPVAIEPDYLLPQGNASQEANDRIQQLYDTYGSYFLYNFTQKDFEWTQSTSTGNSAIDSVVLGNPAYVGDMLDFLDDIWLEFLSEDFKKGGGLPYRIFMVDTIKQRRAGTGWPPGMEYLYSDYKVVGKSITFAGMNASLTTMTPQEKVTKKNLLAGVIYNYYVNTGIIRIPDAFYGVSNYVTQPTLPINAANPANLEAYRARGFVPRSYLANGNPSEWLSNAYSWTSAARSNDLGAYLFHIIQCTDAQMEPLLQYPLIQQKFNILVDHIKSQYGIDVRAIANATY